MTTTSAPDDKSKPRGVWRLTRLRLAKAVCEERLSPAELPLRLNLKPEEVQEEAETGAQPPLVLDEPLDFFAVPRTPLPVGDVDVSAQRGPLPVRSSQPWGDPSTHAWT